MHTITRLRGGNYVAHKDGSVSADFTAVFGSIDDAVAWLQQATGDDELTVAIYLA